MFSTMFTTSPWALRRMFGVLALGLSACLKAQALDDTVERFERARQAYAQYQWQAAFAGFADLAEQGHPESARMAAQMVRWGPRLYGTRFQAERAQVARWLQTSRCSQPSALCGALAAGSSASPQVAPR